MGPMSGDTARVICFCALICLGMLGLAACGGGPSGADSGLEPASEANITPGQNAGGFSQQLPGLPDLEGAGRTAAGTLSNSEKLKYPLKKSDNTQYVSSAPAHLALNSAPGEISWAIYSFSVRKETLARATVQFKHTPAPGSPEDSTLWAAYADYAQRAWRFVPLAQDSEDGVIDLPAGPGAISPGGSVNLLLLSFDGDEQWLTSDLELRYDCADGQLIATSSPSAIHLEWDPVEGAESYRLLYHLKDDPEASFEVLAELDSSQITFDHTQAQPAGKASLWDTAYVYRLQVLSADGVLPSCGTDATGARSLEQPLVTVSDDFASQFMRVDWRPVPGATGYTLFRDAVSTPLAELPSDQLSYVDSDPQVLDGIRHYYYVIAKHAEGNSEAGVGFGRALVLTQFELDSASELDQATPALASFTFDGEQRLATAWRDAAGDEPRFGWAIRDTPQMLADFSTLALPALGAGAGEFMSLSAIGDWAGLAVSRPQGGLAFLRPASTNIAGPADWTVCDIDPASSGRGVQLAPDSDLPVLVYVNANDELVLSFASSAAPDDAGDWTSLVLDSNGKVGSQLSVLFNHQRPTVAYVVEEDGGGQPLQALRIAQSTTTNPSLATDFSVYDLLPGAQVFAAPSLSESGSKLQLDFIDQSGAQAAVRRAVTTGLPSAAADWQLELLHSKVLSGAVQGSLSYHEASEQLSSLVYIAEDAGSAYSLRLLRFYQAFPSTPVQTNEEVLFTAPSSPAMPRLKAIWPEDEMVAVFSALDSGSGKLRLRYAEEL